MIRHTKVKLRLFTARITIESALIIFKNHVYESNTNYSPICVNVMKGSQKRCITIDQEGICSAYSLYELLVEVSCCTQSEQLSNIDNMLKLLFMQTRF